MTDILLNSDLDVAIRNGDLVLGESTSQQQQLLLITEKGSWKENPTVGIGAASYLEDEDPAGLLREIKLQFSQDGMAVNKIAFGNSKIEIDANY
jgi:hypothetical protein